MAAVDAAEDLSESDNDLSDDIKELLLEAEAAFGADETSDDDDDDIEDNDDLDVEDDDDDDDDDEDESDFSDIELTMPGDEVEFGESDEDEEEVTSETEEEEEEEEKGSLSVLQQQPPPQPSIEQLGDGMALPETRGCAISKLFSDVQDDEDTAVRFGDAIRLYTVSRYATPHEPGGYVGYYLQGRHRSAKSASVLEESDPIGGATRRPPKQTQKRSKGRLLVAVPPLGDEHLESFTESCFEVVDPTGTKKEGDLLRYGDEVVLLDDQGMVWNK